MFLSFAYGFAYMIPSLRLDQAVSVNIRPLFNWVWVEGETTQECCCFLNERGKKKVCAEGAGWRWQRKVFLASASFSLLLEAGGTEWGQRMKTEWEIVAEYFSLHFYSEVSLFGAVPLCRWPVHRFLWSSEKLFSIPLEHSRGKNDIN